MLLLVEVSSIQFVMRIVSTGKFSVIEINVAAYNTGSTTSRLTLYSKSYNEAKKFATTNKQPDETVEPIGIFLDIDEIYTRDLILKALRHPSRAPYFHVTLGSGFGFEPVPLPSHCQFQWSEYERIDWHGGVLPGRHGASSFCIRKGLSRKAQLAYHTRRYTCKNPNSALRSAMPQSIILDCWAVWDDDCIGNADTPSMTYNGGLADVVTSIGSLVGGGNSKAMNRRVRLDKCLAEAKDAMYAAELKYQEDIDEKGAAPIWILKGSTTNKGEGIYIVHLYEQVVDHCWAESGIREW
jgi:hypothetical protein